MLRYSLSKKNEEEASSSQGCKAFVALSALLALILKVARLTRAALFRIVIRYYNSKRVARTQTTFSLHFFLFSFLQNHLSIQILQCQLSHATYERKERGLFLLPTEHTIRKGQIFVQKFNFDKKKTFSQFFTQIFLTICLVKSKLSTAKQSKTSTISREYQRKNQQFSRDIKV